MAFGHTIRLPLFVLFSLLLAILAAAQSDCRNGMKLDSVIYADRNSTPWLSPSREFAFGFQALENSASNNKEDLFLLAIWFNNIPERTIVWSKNEHPVPVGSRIQLTKEGQLILYNSWANDQVWSAEIGNKTSRCAAMLDSGNFVLINGDSNYIWQSFSYPTDTILPGQNISKGGNLTSRQSETDYTDGRFQLRMQLDGNLVLYTISLPTQAEIAPYWATDTIKRPNPDHRLIFDKAGGYIYIQRQNDTDFPVMKRDLGSGDDFYYMARLDSDGVLGLYFHPKTNSAAKPGNCSSLWTPIQTIPDDICGAIVGSRGSGACGYNSYCVNANGRPDCRCPEGYSPLDPRDTSRGCKPDFPMPSCQQDGRESDSEFVEFRELSNTNWPTSDYDLQTVVDKDMCKQLCLDDCFCVAVVYNRVKQCWKKRFPLSNGRRSNDLNGTIALVKVRKRLNPKRKDQSAVIVLSALLGSSVFMNFLLLIAIAVAIFFVYHKKLLSLQSPSSVNGIKVYSYKQLEEATSGFKQHLGQGSFGTVYKGVLPSDRRRYVAIKGLDRVEKQGEKEFTTEVSAIGRTHHKNLVTLLGYCDEGNHRLLVYEYMSNGSLAGHLFGLSRPRWNQRMQIASGIARGLTYLHEECSTQIIHCDVKPQNILLDEYLMPKISDFGMAKLLLSEQSRAARTHIRGTIGYFAPEWFRKASISVKVDVYSFGVMILEIICCMSSVEFGLGDQEEALIDWVYDCYSKRKLNKLVENDEEARNDMQSVERLVMVAIWCIQEDPSLRPSMRRVSQMLEGVAEVSVPPRPSGFSSS